VAVAQTCPECGTPLAGDTAGLCPACLMQLGLDNATGEHPAPESNGARAVAVTKVAQSTGHGPATEGGEETDAAAATEAGFAAASHVDEATLLDADAAGQHVAAAILEFLDPCDTPGRMGLLGPYEVIEVIGRGGCGVVLRAFDKKLGRVVAVKVLAPEHAANPAAKQRFEREARAAAAVSHPHVVTIHAVNEEHRTPYLVMECIDGQSLQEKLDKSGQMPIREILRIGMQTAHGLAAAHKQGLMHRDVKPANVLLENGVERVKLTDFGLARAVDDVGMTQTGVVTGTPAYMSPEQAEGRAVDHRSDLFSLGSVLYAMATGRAPFRAGSTVATLRRVCDDEPRPIREVNPDLPEWLEPIVQKLHAKQPEDRFQTAQEVAELLGNLLAEVQNPTGNPSLVAASAAPRTRPVASVDARPHSTDRRSARRRWTVAAAVLLVLLTGVGLTEATGVTRFSPTIVRYFSPAGTLVVEVDDPDVSVSIDGEEVVITGAGAREIRLKPGRYAVVATKDGKPVRRELVTVERNGRQVVRIGVESAASGVAGGENSLENKNRVVVRMEPTGQFSFDGRIVTPSEIPELLKAALAENPDLEVFVDADEKFGPDAVGRLVVFARELGAKHVSSSADGADVDGPLTLGMDEEGRFRLNGRLVSPFDVPRLLAGALAQNPERVVAIDLPKAPWTVAPHVDQLEMIARTAGAKHVTRPAWSEPPREVDAHERRILVSVRDGENGLEVLLDGRSVPPGELEERLQAILRENRDEQVELAVAADETVRQEDADALVRKLKLVFGDRLVANLTGADLRRDAQQARRKNQLRQVGIALHNFHDTYGSFPPAKSGKGYEDEGRPLLSWRVHLLPFLDQRALYERFHLDEPWDSAHNKTLLAEMPPLFKTTDDPTTTTFLAVVGEGTAYEGREGLTFKDIRDGTSSTAYVVDAGRERAVPWTKPEDLPFDVEDPVRALGPSDFGNEFLVVTADGAVKAISYDIAPESLRALFTRAAGDHFDETRRRPPLPTSDTIGGEDALAVYTFEEETFFREAGRLRVRDVSGNGHHASVEDDQPVHAPEGRIGGALLCNRRVLGLPLAKLRLPTAFLAGRDEYTLAVWVRDSGRGTAPRGKSVRTLFQEGMPKGADAVYPLSVNFVDQRMRIFILGELADEAEGEVSINGEVFTDEGTIPKDEWYFLALTLVGKGDGHVLRVTIDDRTTEHPFAPVPAFEHGFGLLGGIDGMIDEVAIYGRALTPEEIDSLRQRGEVAAGEPNETRTRAISSLLDRWIDHLATDDWEQNKPFGDLDGDDAKVMADIAKADRRTILRVSLEVGEKLRASPVAERRLRTVFDNFDVELPDDAEAEQMIGFLMKLVAELGPPREKGDRPVGDDGAATDDGGLTEERIEEMVSAASGIPNDDWTKLASSTERPSIDTLESKTLSLMLLGLQGVPPNELEKSLPGFARDFHYLTERIPKPAEVAKAMWISKAKGYASFVQPEYVTEATLTMTGDTAHGEIAFEKEELYRGRVRYVARRKGGDWRVEEFHLPHAGLSLVLGEEGKWERLSRAAKAD
jgi:biopolymer transport protein ExbD